MIRVVFDTVVIVRALINPHGLWGRLVFRWHDRYRLIMSDPVAAEVEEVLSRPELIEKFRAEVGLDRDRVHQLLSLAERVELQQIPSVVRDQKDDKFIATALAGRASFIVTEDADLLVLDGYEGLRIVTAAAFIDSLEHTAPATNP